MQVAMYGWLVEDGGGGGEPLPDAHEQLVRLGVRVWVPHVLEPVAGLQGGWVRGRRGWVGQKRRRRSGGSRVDVGGGRGGYSRGKGHGNVHSNVTVKGCTCGWLVVAWEESGRPRSPSRARTQGAAFFVHPRRHVSIFVLQPFCIGAPRPGARRGLKTRKLSPGWADPGVAHQLFEDAQWRRGGGWVIRKGRDSAPETGGGGGGGVGYCVRVCGDEGAVGVQDGSPFGVACGMRALLSEQWHRRQCGCSGPSGSGERKFPGMCRPTVSRPSSPWTCLERRSVLTVRRSTENSMHLPGGWGGRGYEWVGVGGMGAGEEGANQEGWAKSRSKPTPVPCAGDCRGLDPLAGGGGRPKQNRGKG
eukprot:scaffold916_cov92-Isochrysis_galbana.AAC.4